MVDSRQGRFEAGGEGAGYRLALGASLVLPGLPELQVEAEGEGDGQGLRAPRLYLRRDATEVVASARLDWSDGFGFEAGGDWRDLQWPLDADAMVRSANGRFSVSGVPQRFDLVLGGPLRLPQGPPLEVELASVVDPAGMRVERLDLLGLDGRARVEGRLDWSPALAWDLALEASDLDPGRHWPEWSGRLALAARSQGRLVDGELVGAAVDIERIGGNLRDRPVEASARLGWEDAGLMVSDGRLGVGDNRIRLDGRLDRAPAFTARIDAPDLATLWPGLGGSLNGQVDWRGPPGQARISASIEGQALKFDAYAVETLALSVEQDPERPEASGLKLALTRVQGAGLPLQTVELQGKGLPAEHRLELRHDVEEEDGDCTDRSGNQYGRIDQGHGTGG